MLALAGTLATTLPSAGQAVCSALSRHPCVYHPYFQVCTVFGHHACTYEPNYPFGEQLQLTIYSEAKSDAPSESIETTRSQLRTIRDVFAELRRCWIPPGEQAVKPGTQISVRLSFRRDGSIFGAPKLTYATPGIPQGVRKSYWEAIMGAFHRCTPLPFDKGLGGALAGRPFAIRFVDDRGHS
jgi:hypothetical protein